MLFKICSVYFILEYSLTFVARDIPRPQFEVENVGAHELIRNRLNGGQGQNKIGSVHLRHVGIAIHT